MSTEKKSQPTPRQRDRIDATGKVALRQRKMVHDAILAEAYQIGMEMLGRREPAEHIVRTLMPHVASAARFEATA